MIVDNVTPKMHDNMAHTTIIRMKSANSSLKSFSKAETTGIITQKGRKQQHQHTATIDGVNKF